MNKEKSSGSKGPFLSDLKGNSLTPDQAFKTPSQIFENFAEKVAQAELADVNIAFQAHIATDDEEDSEDGSIAGTSCKDNYHIGLDMCETTIQDMKWMRRANWQNNPTSHLSRTTSIDLTEQLEEKVKFMRLSIEGERDSPHHFIGVGDVELLDACTLLAQSLKLREKYMEMSQQRFHVTTKRHLQGSYGPLRASTSAKGTSRVVQHYHASPNGGDCQRELPYNLDYGSGYADIYEPFNCTPPDDLNYTLKLHHGVVKVYKSEAHELKNEPLYEVKSNMKSFVKDYNVVLSLAAHGPVKTFCFKRLCYLESKFNLHILLNEQNETAAQKAVPHRDFYNVRKVDTHIHGTSSFNQKHLLRFIKKKLKKYPHDKVYQAPDGHIMTLQEVFESLNLNAYDLSTDSLDVHADKNTFHRFDKFNQKYNPLGKSMLRDIFLKTNNYIKGRYFAELIKEVAADLEESKYQSTEPRLSIYGNCRGECDRLADWAINNNVVSPNIRFLIQIPRLYDVYKAKNMVSNFEEIIANTFLPIIEASVNPSSNPNLHKFLNMVVGFDSVDDESKADLTMFNSECPTPDQWTSSKNPPYSYYLYFMYANIAVVNMIRRDRGLNTFSFRPHSGEAGSINHLVTSFLLAEGINHGLLLRKAPALQYLFYLCQVTVAMSPLSNNSLFLDYHRNPLPVFFSRGIPVSLSTDDPMQFHYTKEPLMEEYSIASQVWKMTPCDMCELAMNSVLTSGFERKVKQHWLGKNFEREGTAGNDIRQSNVPNIRIAFRHETLCDELTMVCETAQAAVRSRQTSADNST
ncbi:hypothetical protein ACHWQZ_G001277 [Mnemiopsis leidyi]